MNIIHKGLLVFYWLKLEIILRWTLKIILSKSSELFLVRDNKSLPCQKWANFYCSELFSKCCLTPKLALFQLCNEGKFQYLHPNPCENHLCFSNLEIHNLITLLQDLLASFTFSYVCISFYVKQSCIQNNKMKIFVSTCTQICCHCV